MRSTRHISLTIWGQGGCLLEMMLKGQFSRCLGEAHRYKPCLELVIRTQRVCSIPWACWNFELKILNINYFYFDLNENIRFCCNTF